MTSSTARLGLASICRSTVLGALERAGDLRSEAEELEWGAMLALMRQEPQCHLPGCPCNGTAEPEEVTATP